MSEVKKYKTIIKIKYVEGRFNLDGQEILDVYSEDGKRYTHFIDEKNEGWEKKLQGGVSMPVYVVAKPNSKYPKFPYLNIYPDHFNLEPVSDDDLNYEPVN